MPLLSQAVTASLTLSAFGQTVTSTGSSTSAYQYGASSGYRTEGDVGLMLVGCQFYDAQVGRFITRDTYLDQAPYAYCEGDPVNAMDPSGHKQKAGPKKPVPPVPPVVPIPRFAQVKIKFELGADGKFFKGTGSLEYDGPTVWREMTPPERKSVHSGADLESWVFIHLVL